MAGKTPPDGTGSAHVPEVAPGARQPQPDPPRPGGCVGGGGGRPADVSDPRGVVAGRGRRRGTGEPDPVRHAPWARTAFFIGTGLAIGAVLYLVAGVVQNAFPSGSGSG